MAENWDTIIILIDAVIDSQLIVWSAFLIACGGALRPVLEALQLAKDGHTRIVLVHTSIHTYLVVASATCRGA